MKLVTTAQMRELDRRTIEEFGIPGDVLMDRAGLGVAQIVDYVVKMWGFPDSPVRLFAGRGNNGGDAFVAARYLKEQGYSVDVWIVGEIRKIAGDPLKHFSRLKSLGVEVREYPTKADWDELLARDVQCPAGVLVDGILGTGIRGPARGPAAGAIQYINSLAARRMVVAIDVPSGLDSDTGEAEGDAVRADVTVTMGLPKRGLATPPAMDFVGSLEVVDIGIPAALTDLVDVEDELVTAEDLRPVMKRRPRGSHKGTFGHTLVIAGAPGYMGAAAMACRAALRSGTGLVSALVPAGIASTVAGLAPEAMVHSGRESDTGSLCLDALTRWACDISLFDAVLVGPGMTTHAETGRIVEWLLANCRVPLVIDADGLNVLAGKLDAAANRSCPLVITPHPGEMARLQGCAPDDVQGDRPGCARRAAEETGGVVVLKGAGTLVVESGKPVHINMTGNPGMAKGGMGDVLGGILAGFLAQGWEPLESACMAVHLHGRAGDHVAWRSSQAGMTAGDVIHELAHVYREITLR